MGGSENESDEWVLDEVRREADSAVQRGSRRASAQKSNQKASAAKRRPETSKHRADDRGAEPGEAVASSLAELEHAVGAQRADRLERRLKDASRAFRRERYVEARQILRGLAREAPSSANVRELLGLCWYREGRWKDAIKELETFRDLTRSTEQNPVLADCYRAVHKWTKVEALWDQLRADSPSADLVAEGRIVMAGSLADQGRFADAIRVLEDGRRKVKAASDRHFRMAYALADIQERAGDVPAARELFAWVQREDPGFADVNERIRALS